MDDDHDHDANHHEDDVSQGLKTQVLTTCCWMMFIRAGNDDILCPVPCSRGQVWGNKKAVHCCVMQSVTLTGISFGLAMWDGMIIA